MPANERIHVECNRCVMISCKELKISYNTKEITGLDGEVIHDYPEPILECEVLRDAIPEEQMLLLLKWYQLREALLESE